VNTRTGGCSCGAVRYRVGMPPLWVAHCHCSMCRRAQGAAFVTWISPGQRLDWKNNGDPQRVQKLRVAAAEDWKRPIRSAPVSTTQRSWATPNHVTNAAPCARRHIEQWQCATHSGGMPIR